MATYHAYLSELNPFKRYELITDLRNTLKKVGFKITFGSRPFTEEYSLGEAIATVVKHINKRPYSESNPVPAYYYGRLGIKITSPSNLDKTIEEEFNSWHKKHSKP